MAALLYLRWEARLTNANVRVVAAKALSSIFKEQGSLMSLLKSAEKKVSAEDVGLLKALCFGVMRHYRELNYILASRMDKPLRAKDKDIYCLLLLGVYQLIYTNVPAHAAINETAGAANKLKKRWATGLVNGLLRGIQRNPVKAPKPVDHPEYYHNHPDWLIEKLQGDWPTFHDQIISANNTRAPMTLRVNRQLISRDRYLSLLEQSNLMASIGKYSNDAIYLKVPCQVDELPLWNEGAVSVQDEAAQLSAALLDPQPNERILDACAAPGGKTCHLLEYQDNLSVTAIELEESRAQRIYENLERLNLKADILVADARETDTWWSGQAFDKILLDAPCSATGVIRRHPDIRFLRSAQAIDELSKLQLAILNALWPTLKSGGRLLYATCSSLKQENEQTIASFLEKADDAIEIKIKSLWGVSALHGKQLFPTVDGHDGFYYCLLEKR